MIPVGLAVAASAMSDALVDVAVRAARLTQSEAPAPSEILVVIDDPSHRIVATLAAGCKADIPCEIAIAITAAPGRTVSVEYPAAFHVSESEGVSFPVARETMRRGKLVPSFDRLSGSIEPTIDHGQIIHVLLTPAATAPHRVNGRLRFATCDAVTCKVESVELHLLLRS